jgi:hypothetical protein
MKIDAFEKKIAIFQINDFVVVAVVVYPFYRIVERLNVISPKRTPVAVR